MKTFDEYEYEITQVLETDIKIKMLEKCHKNLV